MIIFVTGGARSGKSDFVQEMAETLEGKRLFLATAEALDDEMKERIRKHKEKRGDRWDTLEEPLDLGNAIQSVSKSYRTILVDCLTVWLSNLLIEYEDEDEIISEMIDDFFSSMDDCKETFIVVSNEVGLGIVPDNKLVRIYRDKLGFLNQRMAKRADQVYILFSGIPVKIKG
ncbi:MAG: bifunctional adenosylcobinamide kinase/adenosylcobinamide-phosphate guanylyltransferase [Deltaproteobacteria bacterium]|nr:bifunctional adenosylcobinamide kinase/adenosylcobinamide-phosphate guanylyltransferase [Deltaproteobacteria bacterium]